MKTALIGLRFTEPEAVLKGINDFLGRIEISELTAVFHGWVKRVRWIIEQNGDLYPN
jgi:hypothetical protein